MFSSLLVFGLLYYFEYHIKPPFLKFSSEMVFKKKNLYEIDVFLSLKWVLLGLTLIDLNLGF